MAAGLPVVATDIPGFSHVVSPGHHGILVRKDDAVSLASAINLLADDPGLRARLGAEGHATAASYSWDRVVDQVVQVYEESLSRFNPNRVSMEEERVHYAVPGLG